MGRGLPATSSQLVPMGTVDLLGLGIRFRAKVWIEFRLGWGIDLVRFRVSVTVWLWKCVPNYWKPMKRPHKNGETWLCVYLCWGRLYVVHRRQFFLEHVLLFLFKVTGGLGYVVQLKYFPNSRNWGLNKPSKPKHRPHPGGCMSYLEQTSRSRILLHSKMSSLDTKGFCVKIIIFY